MLLMLLKIFKILLGISVIAFTLSVFIYKIFIMKQKDNMKNSNFVAFIAASLGLYVIFGLLVGLLSQEILTKIVMTAAVFSPFFIGGLVKYKTELIYTFVQIITMIGSILYLLFLA